MIFRFERKTTFPSIYVWFLYCWRFSCHPKITAFLNGPPSGPLVGEETRDLEEVEGNVDDKVMISMIYWSCYRRWFIFNDSLIYHLRDDKVVLTLLAQEFFWIRRGDWAPCWACKLPRGFSALSWEPLLAGRAERIRIWRSKIQRPPSQAVHESLLGKFPRARCRFCFVLSCFSCWHSMFVFLACFSFCMEFSSTWSKV